MVTEWARSENTTFLGSLLQFSEFCVQSRSYVIYDYNYEKNQKCKSIVRWAHLVCNCSANVSICVSYFVLCFDKGEDKFNIFCYLSSLNIVRKWSRWNICQLSPTDCLPITWVVLLLTVLLCREKRLVPHQNCSHLLHFRRPAVTNVRVISVIVTVSGRNWLSCLLKKWDCLHVFEVRRHNGGKMNGRRQLWAEDELRSLRLNLLTILLRASERSERSEFFRI